MTASILINLPTLTEDGHRDGHRGNNFGKLIVNVFSTL
jgi:hypothetical protein